MAPSISPANNCLRIAFADEILKESDSVVQRRKEVGKMVQALMKSEAIVASVV